jgi:hypothetical protein
MKWQLLLKVLPLTALFTLAKVATHRLDWEPWAFDSLTGALFGAATFVIAFILSGTLADYNNSEDMAIQIVNAIESMEDGNQLAAYHHPEYNPEPLRQGLGEVLHSILGWLKARRPQEEVEQALNQLNPLFAEVTKFSLPPVVNRLQLEQGKIRLLVRRIQVNRDTNFLEPAYALLEIFLVGAVIALLLIKSELFSETLVVSMFLFTSFTYLVLLVKDLDNPFQYDGSSCVDVDLSRLEEKRDRLMSKTIHRG